MLDLDLLRSFVSVVDAGGFTRAGERVHRTQSTVSQQVRKLEQAVGRPLLVRHPAGRGVTPTEDGERLLGYARRLLAIAAEADDVLRRPEPVSIVRLGVPEDFAARRLTDLLSGFARAHPRIRLDTVSGMSTDLRRLLDAGEIDLALAKREPADGPCIASWPERLAWVAGPAAAAVAVADPVPLAAFPQGCLYRSRATHALDAAGRPWRIAYASQSLVGIQAAVSSGLGITILPETAILPDHRRLGPKDGFPDVPQTELALLPPPRGRSALARGASRLAEYLAGALDAPG